jgi:HTH-type transcriptional regulator / antitoxin HigA
MNLKPARNFGPGYFIREQMEYRNWNLENLSDALSIAIEPLNKILYNEQAITPDIAKVLAVVFENSPQYWLNLDANYRHRLKN